jgi:hypothetical protein
MDTTNDSSSGGGNSLAVLGGDGMSSNTYLKDQMKQIMDGAKEEIRLVRLRIWWQTFVAQGRKKGWW